MNDFERDDAWQKMMRNTILAPSFYGQYATDGRYVFLDKGRLATLLQRRCAADTVLQGKGGEAVFIEEKIVRFPKSGWPYTAFCLETDSCTRPGRESLGWMHYGRADYLLYCFQTAEGHLGCHLVDFPKLKEWFWQRHESFAVFGPLDTLNATKGRVVPIEAVKRAVPHWPFMAHRPASAAA